MKNFASFFVGMILKIGLLTIIASIIVFLIFDACFEKVNPEYESFDAFYFFLLLSIIAAFLAGIFACFILLNYNSYIRHRAILSAITFYMPVVPLLFLPLWYSDRIGTKIFFLFIPLSVAVLQAYHFRKFRIKR